MRIALAGGGSGGHLFPGLAMAKSLSGEVDRPVLFGSDRVGEATWVGDAAERVPLQAPRLPSKGTELPGFLVRLSKAVSASLREIRARRPDVVVGLGGYASVGPGLAALIARRPLVLLEQNVVPGKANRLLAGLGGRFAASFAQSLASLPEHARRRARVVGNPVRPAVLGGRRDPARFGLDPSAPVLLVMGGSQGAEGLNSAVAEAADILAMGGIGILHLAGAGRDPEVRDALERAGARAWVAPFTEDMGAAYATADLVLCRAGGTTLAELTVLGKPSVLVPYPHHADRHQEANARVLSDTGAAFLVPEGDLTPDLFYERIVPLLRDREALDGMGAAARLLGMPDAALEAARWVQQLVTEVRR